MLSCRAGEREVKGAACGQTPDSPGCWWVMNVVEMKCKILLGVGALAKKRNKKNDCCCLDGMKFQKAVVRSANVCVNGKSGSCIACQRVVGKTMGYLAVFFF